MALQRNAQFGKIMKHYYDYFIDNVPKFKSLPKSKYLCVSRKVLNYANFFIDDSNYDFFLSGTAKKTIEQYFKRIDLNCKDFGHVLFKHGFDSTEKLISSSEEFERLKHVFIQIQPILKAKAREYYTHLTNYFHENGLFASSEVIVADIGWHGSMQKSINNILNPMGGGIKCYGYYFGLYEYSRRNFTHNNLMKGFFMNAQENNYFEKFVKHCPEMFEFIFSATHGTTVGYKKNDKKTEPLFDPGSALNLKEIEQMRAGASEFIKEYFELDRKLNFSINFTDQDIIDSLYYLILFPRTIDIKNFSNILHYEGFGTVLNTPSKLIESNNKNSYWNYTKVREQTLLKEIY
jgi:hypothetical protein